MHSEQNGNASAGADLHWKRHVPWLLSCLATVLVGLALWGALAQPPHFDAFRPEPSLLSGDFWGYPIERNAFRRLPVIESNLNDVFALPGGKQVWAVGDLGLILHSSDGGYTWQQQVVTTGKDKPPSPLSGMDLFGNAWAEATPPTNASSTQSQGPGSNQPLPATTAQTPAAAPATGSPAQQATQSTQAAVEKEADFWGNLSSVYFTDAEHGWAVGKSGTIVATQDGGQRWRIQVSGTQADLYGVAFSDALHGWAVGWYGTIFATQDGGQSWRAQASSTGENFTGVAFSDALHGWAVGGSGTIVATLDGGQNWRAQESGTQEYLNGVAFSDALHGWAVGGTIIATQDGGQSWRAQASGTTQDYLTGAAFSDAEHGWAIGPYGTIVATQDGGQSWRAQASGALVAINSVAFSDAEHGWAVGDNGTIVATEDGGQHWRAQVSGGFTGVAFSDAEHGWAVGGRNMIAATQDGGQRWRAQASEPQEYLNGVAFNDALHGWAVGSGTIVATLDGGQNWRAQASGTQEGLFDVAFSDALHGWAVGQSGTIVATQDGGQSWRAQTSGTLEDLNSMAFSDGEHGWAVGDNGTIVATQDGGQSWRGQASGTQEYLNGVAFSDALHGWAVGENGTVVATQDGGQSWRAQASGTLENLRGVVFSDTLHGWAVGQSGTIVATQDGGQNWRAQASGTQAYLNGVAFSDTLHGWAVGQNGTVVVTQDGGQSWRDIAYRCFPAPWVYFLLLAALCFYGGALWIWAKQGRPTPHQAGIANRVVTDKPAGPGSPDFLGARRIARELTRFLVNRNTQPPVTIAITGEWGSGKSSIMNYLFGSLRREGLTPVWFNAWHHREEQNVLASILDNVHKQAIRPWWSLSGLCFRLHLLWRRNWLTKSALSIIAFGFCFMASWLYAAPDKREEARHFALYLMHIEQPVVLSQNKFDALCPDFDAAAVGPALAATSAPAGENAGSTDEKTASGNNETEAEKQPIEQAVAPAPTKGKQSGSVQNDAKNQKADEATVKVSEKPPEPPKVQQKANAKGYFSAEQCAKLQALSLAMAPSNISTNCDEDGTKGCFNHEGALLAAVEKNLNITLTDEATTELSKAIEHLSPELPLPLPGAMGRWLAGLAALLGLLTLKGMALLGLAPAQLFQGLLNKSGMPMQSAEPVGTRQLFEDHFKQITELLGKRRLVLFIDDLDRCDREHTCKVLEITNFLAGSGDLFMVLGMAPRYVLANVTLSFQELAKAVHEADVLNGEAPNGAAAADAGQSWFARHYLQKLIHIEVPVPKANAEQVLAMLKAEEGELDKIEQQEKQIDSFFSMLGQFARWGLLVAAIGLGGYGGYRLSQPQPERAQNFVPQQDVGKQTEGGQSTASKETQPSPNVQIKPGESRPKELFRTGYTAENMANWPLWAGLTLLFALVFGGLGLTYLVKHVELIRDVNRLAWLETLLRRLKVKLFGPELREDSASFAEALDAWHRLIAITDPSPRNLKAFLNRLRYFASRYAGAADSRREAQLVALATMHYAFDEKLTDAIALMSAYEASPQNPMLSAEQGTDVRWQALAAALQAHRQKFSAFPSREDREFFQYLCDDIRIHRRD